MQLKGRVFGSVVIQKKSLAKVMKIEKIIPLQKQMSVFMVAESQVSRCGQKTAYPI